MFDRYIRPVKTLYQKSDYENLYQIFCAKSFHSYTTANIQNNLLHPTADRLCDPL